MTGLDNYRPLGRSGLRVSPLALGTVGALAPDVSASQLDHLTAVSAPELPFPHSILARLNTGL